jgi:hypothetical protein
MWEPARGTFVISAQNILQVDRDAGVSKRQVREELNVSHVAILRAPREQLLYP